MPSIRTTATPGIEVARAGPYLVRGVDSLIGPDGQPIATTPDMALCRCGHSGAKPFCDGAHARCQFEGTLRPEFPPTRAYAGHTVAVGYNRAICAHVGICTARLPRVFNVQARPWIQPDAAAVDDVIDTVHACPSGALHLPADPVAPRAQDRAPTIRLFSDGPAAVTAVPLRNVTWADGATTDHYTLCRCGGSKSMPFCDGSHVARGFRDDGVGVERGAVPVARPDDPVALSYQRSLEQGGFADTFYRLLFERSDAVARLFGDTDFGVQKPLFRYAVGLLVRFGAGDADAETEMERLAQRHARDDLNIDPTYYTVWLDVLCDALREHDASFDQDLEQAWRRRMQPGITLMMSRY